MKVEHVQFLRLIVGNSANQNADMLSGHTYMTSAKRGEGECDELKTFLEVVEKGCEYSVIGINYLLTILSCLRQI